MGDGTVSVIDGYTNRVVKTIQVAAAIALDEIGVNDKTNTVYVPEAGGATVKVIDGRTSHIIKSIPVGHPPTPPGCAVYVNCSDNGSQPSTVGINRLTDMIYIGRYGDSLVTVIDAKTNQVIGSIPVCDEPEATAVDEDSNTIYVPCQNSGAVSVIDGRTNQVIGSPIPVGSGAPIPPGCDVQQNCTNQGSDPFAAVVNEETNTVYVTASGDGSIAVINGRTKQVIKTFPVGSGPATPLGCYFEPCAKTMGSIPAGIALNRKTNTVYVANYGDGSLSVIDAKTNEVVGSPVLVGSGAPKPAGCTIFRICTITNGAVPNSVRVNEETDRIYIPNSNDGTVTVLDGGFHSQ
jgi:YVTN family beta-propeller protein